MADAISTAISTLKLALARRPHRPLHVITSWRTLAASVEFRGTADPSLSPQHWTALATSRVITELVQNLLPQALRLDIDAESCASASCALSRCYNFAIFMHTDEGLTEAADALKLVESRFPSLLADWWEGQRAEVPKWLETNLFNDYSRYFVELFNTMSARDDDREPDNFRLCALKAHPIIQDFLLTRAIYGNSRTSEDITTTMLCLKGADPHRTPSLEELELLTVRTLLGRGPTALSNLVENLLTSPQSDMKDSPGV
ncbi:hypothetical protein FRB93_001163 [Tulasnella sp. JGI-2019a]|nr:hypothetical protein FRB93_001163 [Tulasnella sp. JGI-2019a]